jgi:hypothetical protein
MEQANSAEDRDYSMLITQSVLRAMSIIANNVRTVNNENGQYLIWNQK